MADRSRRSTEDALLEWVNSFDVAKKAEFISDLNDGHIFWNILRDIDSDHFTGDLPENSNHYGTWPQSRKNLKHVAKALHSYIIQCNRNLAPSSWAVDLKSIAMKGKSGDLLEGSLETKAIEDQVTVTTACAKQLLKLVLFATVNSPQSMEYIGKMTKFSQEAQGSIKTAIEEMEMYANTSVSDDGSELPQTPKRSSNDESPHSNGSNSRRRIMVDRELLLEERLGKAISNNEILANDKKKLQGDVQEFQNRLGRLQQHNDTLQTDLTQAQDELKNNPRQNSVVIGLNSKIQEQETLIAALETQISDRQGYMDTLEDELEKGRKSHDRAQKLQDDLDEIKADRDSLKQRANTLNKLTAKLQTYVGIERTNESLHSELAEVKRELAEVKLETKKVSRLELENKELQVLLPQIEQDRVELQKMKQTLEADNALLRERYSAADNRHSRDLEIITELEDKRGNRDSHSISATDELSALDDLLDSRTNNADEMFQDRIKLLLGELNELNAKHTQLELTEGNIKEQHLDTVDKLQDARKESLALESSLTSFNGGNFNGFENQPLNHNILAHDVSSIEVFRRIREQILLAQRNKADLETRCADLQRQISSTHNGTATNEHSQLNQQIEAAKQMIHKAFASQDDVYPPQAEKSLEAHITDLTKAVVTGREKLAAQSENLKCQIAELKELRERPGNAQTKTQPLADGQDQTLQHLEKENLALRQELENVKRENKLIATAFYDLGTRMQLSTVSLVRRSEPNRSFLNKHRAQVNRATEVRTEKGGGG